MKVHYKTIEDYWSTAYVSDTPNIDRLHEGSDKYDDRIVYVKNINDEWIELPVRMNLW